MMREASFVRTSHESRVRMRDTSYVKVIGIAVLALVVSAHVGSPDVFFTGQAGPYDIRVVIRPPEVVPGVARVTVRAPNDVQRVTIRPVFWRAGSKGAPSPDDARRLDGAAGTFEGSLWLMARGAYGVDVMVAGPRGSANVLVPVASVATGRLPLKPGFAAVLAAFGVLLFAGLVTIVYKGAGEGLLGASEELDPTRRRAARRAAAIAVPILALAVFGGSRWWDAVDGDYQRTMYRPSPLALSLSGNTLRLQATDAMWLPSGRVSRMIPDHGKLMHLFLVRADDARAFAHLHPVPIDTTPNPPFAAKLPPLPAGQYHVFGDVVHETGFERTLVGSLAIPEQSATQKAESRVDADDAWFVGEASRTNTARLEDGSTMEVQIVPEGQPSAGTDATIRISVRDPKGQPAQLQPYLGMSAHGVVVRVDGAVYVHLHPMGTITQAAQEAFLARDRGDTTAGGRLLLGHEVHATEPAPMKSAQIALPSLIEFPYAFPKSGSYRLFVQVKRNGRVLTGAFAIMVAEASVVSR